MYAVGFQPLAGAIGAHCPGQKHGQRFGRGKYPLAMLGYRRFDTPQQLWIGEPLEESMSIARLSRSKSIVTCSTYSRPKHCSTFFERPFADIDVTTYFCSC